LAFPDVPTGVSQLRLIADNGGLAGDRFVKVFDVLDSSFKDWPFPAFGLIFVVIGIVILIFPTAVRAAGIPYLNMPSRFQKFSLYGVLGFSLLWTANSFSETYFPHLRHKALTQDNRCRTVEGPVERFVPMPYTGHGVESFSVGGAAFEYSDFIVTDGFNNTSSHGGPVRADSYVRICYDPSDGAILRLEIRDFKGDLKDYAKTQGIFPKPPAAPNISGRNLAIDIPWYSSLFIVLYVIDLIAIYALYLPYVRTFFRIKTVAVRDGALPVLEAGKKTKLRNGLVYWDTEDRAIWLRPRGFNLVQIPLMVAKLNGDAGGTSISEYQIRFSSGAPFMLALFLWTAYRLFSATMPANAPLSPALFVGIAALFVSAGGYFDLRILCSRMERLVEDALSEGKERPNSRV
jgi:hypothetical protein